jgi:hypothetical protein
MFELVEDNKVVFFNETKLIKVNYKKTKKKQPIAGKYL